MLGAAHARRPPAASPALRVSSAAARGTCRTFLLHARPPARPPAVPRLLVTEFIYAAQIFFDVIIDAAELLLPP